MYLEEMNYLQVEEYLKTSDTVVIPVGSLENHGKHMPLGTDMMIPREIARLADTKERNAAGPGGLLIAPAIPYGATDALEGFAGTVSLGTAGLEMILGTVCDKLYSYGFRHFIVLNGHGGNNKAIEEVGIRLYKKGALLADFNWWLIAGEVNPEWKGGHGGGEETAAIMGIDPSLIKYEYINEPEGVRSDISAELPSGGWNDVIFRGASIIIPRPIHAVTDNGWLAHGMGIDPPTKATAEWGREMLAAMAELLVDFAGAFSRAELPLQAEKKGGRG